MIRRVLPSSALIISFLCAPTLAANMAYPDRNLTPGRTRADVSVEQLCGTNWSKLDRPVSAAMRRDVFAEYHLKGDGDPFCTAHGGRKCKIDHLIAPKLGGAEVETNLWPQSNAGIWGAPAKDKLEDCMHTRVCAKLEKAGPSAATQLLRLYQHDLVSDWIAAYRNVIGDPRESCKAL